MRTLPANNMYVFLISIYHELHLTINGNNDSLRRRIGKTISRSKEEVRYLDCCDGEISWLYVFSTKQGSTT